jgi:transcriptional regulator with XRE-family HTH domain
MQKRLDDHLKKIASNIRAQRMTKNYTQEYLALKLKISQNAYSKIELGRTQVTVGRLIQIADVLEIELTTLIGVAKAEQELIHDRFRLREHISA